jgi:hypothetical protein
VISSAATGPWGGLTLTRPETTGSKLVFGSAIASSKETGIELDCVVNGFTAGKGTFIAGFSLIQMAGFANKRIFAIWYLQGGS